MKLLLFCTLVKLLACVVSNGNRLRGMTEKDFIRYFRVPVWSTLKSSH